MPDGTEWGEVPVTASAKHELQLMKKDSVTLSWKASDCECVPMGAYVIVDGIRYTLQEPYYPESKQMGEYTYAPEFVHEVMMLDKIPFLLFSVAEGGNNAETVQTVESDWNFTGKGSDLVSTLEAAINNGIGTHYSISIAEDLEAALSLSFSNVSVLSAINSIADAWKCEWWVDEWVNGYTGRHILYFGKSCIHEGGNVSTLELTAGMHVDFPNSNNKATFYNRFYVFGSTRNIPQDYSGAQANSIVNKRLTLDPQLHPGGFIDLPRFDDEGNILTTEGDTTYPFYDEKGNVQYFVPDESLAAGRVFTKVITLEDVYPKADLRVKSIQTVQQYVRDNSGNKVQIGTDTDGNPTYSQYLIYFLVLEDGEGNVFTINKSTYTDSNTDGSLIKGQTLSLHFKTGALTGREFQAAYYDVSEKKYDTQIAVNSFEVIYSQDNTIIIPNTGIAPVVGDEVIVFNIRMPQQYITAGYKELEKKALLQIYEETRDTNEYTVKLNQVWAADNNPSLTLGRHVKLHIGNRTIDTRAINLTTALDRAYEQEVGFSKGISKGVISTLKTSIETTQRSVVEVMVADDEKVRQVRKQLYDAQRELLASMFDTDGYFTAPISPVSIETAMVSVGAKSTELTLSGVVFNANYEGTVKNGNYVFVQSNNGKLTHYGVSDEPKTWNVNAKSETLTDSGMYYIYAECSRTGTACNIVFSQQQYKFNSDEGVWRFLLGAISSYDSTTKERVLSLTYGSSTINGRFIKTGRISSNDGNTYFDLDTGEISGDIKFTASQRQTIEGYATDAANAVVDGLEIGGRNCILNTANSLSITIPANKDNSGNYNQYDLVASSAMKFATVSEEFDATFQFKVDNWTKDYPPVGDFVLGSNGTGDAWSMRIHFKQSSMRQLTETTRLYYSTARVNAGATNIGNIWGGGVFKVLTQYTVLGVVSATSETATIYDLKLERGAVPTDWTPAPEDTQSAIAKAQTAADAAQATIDGMNGDNVFSTIEKKSFRPEWEAISGNAATNINLDNATSQDGSYHKCRDAARAVGLSVTPLATPLGTLRTYLDDMKLYTTENTSGFSQQTLGGYLKAYYNAEEAMWNAIAAKLTEQATAGLGVGGRNLLLKSDGSSSAKLSLHIGSSLTTLDGVSCIVAPTANNNSGFYIQKSNMSSDTNKTDTIPWTLSVDVLATAANTVLGWGLEGKKTESRTIATANVWQRISISGTSVIGTAIFYKQGTTAAMYFKKWKLERGSVATDWTPAPEDVDEAAAAAQAAADAAQQTATQATTALANYASDSVISPTEKRSLVQQKNDILEEYNDIVAQAQRYALTSATSYTDYVSAKNRAITAIDYYAATSTWASHIPIQTSGNYTWSYIGAYYGYRQKVLDAIAAASKKLATDAGTEAEKAKLIAAAAPNLWPDRSFAHTSYWSIGSASSVTAPNGTARLITGRDNTSSFQFDIIVGHVYRVECWAVRLSGSLPLNGSLWWMDMESGDGYFGYGNMVSDGRTCTAGGYTWTHYYRNISVPSSVVRPKHARPYFQLEQAAGATACQWLINDLVITDYTALMDTYLTDAMQEAKSGTTDITGGLVLTKFIGVKGTDGNTVVAGMNGSADSSNGLPMIFAGRDATNTAGKFQVDRSGELRSTNGTNAAVLDNAKLEFLVGEDIKNVITSQKQTGISNMLALAHAEGAEGDSTAVTLTKDLLDNSAGDLTIVSSFNRSTQKVNTVNAKAITLSPEYSGSKEETLVSSTTDEGTIKFSGITAKAQVGLAFDKEKVLEYDGVKPSTTTTSAFSASVYVTVNYSWSVSVVGKVVAEGSGTAKQKSTSYSGSGYLNTTWLDLDVSSDIEGTKAFSQNETLKAVTTLTVSSVIVSVPELPAAGLTGNSGVEYGADDDYPWTEAVWYRLRLYKVSVKLTVSSFHWQWGQTAYMNQIFANGMMMSSTDEKYFGVDPDVQTGGVLLQTRNTNAIYKLTADGLLWNGNGGNTFYRVNPLVLIVEITYSNYAYNATVKYNPLGKSVSVTRNRLGVFTLTHKLGHTNYSVVGTGISLDGYGINVNVNTIGGATCGIRLFHDSDVDGNVIIHIFDYKTY